MTTSSLFLFNNCGGGGGGGGSKVSKAESIALKKPAFNVSYKTSRTSIVSAEVNDGEDFGDSILPVDPFVETKADISFSQNADLSKITDPEALNDYVKVISEDSGVIPGVGEYANIKTTYDFEKAVVEKMVEDRIAEIESGEDLPLLIPVEFQFTTGDKHDWLSYMAYNKSILRSDSDGESIIQTKNHDVAYQVSHEKAREDFISGKMKYFSFVEVKQKLSQSYGTTYGNYKTKWKLTGLNTWQLLQSHLLSGLPTVNGDYIQHVKATGTLPYSSLNLADIRSPIVPELSDIQLMQDDVAIVGRNKEVIRFLKDTFNLSAIVKNKQRINLAFSTDRLVSGFQYRGYNGMAQVLDRLNSETKSARLTTSTYTPIVLDLGRPHIRTTSENWGTYFNLANGRTYIDGVAQPHAGDNTYSHKTAWLGGYLHQDPVEKMWTRVADDGFLILPKDGTVDTSEQLFGSYFVNPKNPSEKYIDGFDALQAYAGTRDACAKPYTSMSYKGSLTDDVLYARYEDVKARYIGPWNEVYKDLRIWVDKNMSGVVDTGEIETLQEAGVMAINTCLLPDHQTKEVDQYGNKTELRSAFLFDEEFSTGEITAVIENKILRTIATGTKDSGKNGDFRLVVDIFFRSVPSDFLERSLSYRSTKLGKPVEIRIDDMSITTDKFKGVTYVEIR